MYMYMVHVAPLCNLKALSFAMSKYINVGTENGCSNWEHGHIYFLWATHTYIWRVADSVTTMDHLFLGHAVVATCKHLH